MSAGRIRMIKPELLDLACAAGLSSDAWRCWISMWLLADDWGNLRAAPRLLAASIFQDTNKVDVVLRALAELVEMPEACRVELYRAGAEVYAHLCGWRGEDSPATSQYIRAPGKPRVPKPDATGATWVGLDAISMTYTPSRGISPRPSESFRDSPVHTRGRGSPISDLRSPISEPDLDLEYARGGRAGEAEETSPATPRSPEHPAAPPPSATQPASPPPATAAPPADERPGFGADPVAETERLLRAQPPPICWLADVRAHERLAAGCLGGQARLEDVAQGIARAAVLLGPELGAVQQDDRAGLARVEEHVAIRVMGEPRRRLEREGRQERDRAGAPVKVGALVRSTVEGPLLAWARETWGQAYEAAPWGYGRYQPGDQDDQALERVLQQAQRRADQSSPPGNVRSIFESAVGKWFEDRYYHRSGHSLAWLATMVDREPARWLSVVETAPLAPAFEDEEPEPKSDRMPIRLPLDQAPPAARQMLSQLLHGAPARGAGLPPPMGARPKLG